jgi:uncharacterized membrane protein YoaK (UPF0700 family)
LGEPVDWATNMVDVDSPKEHVDSGDVGLALLGFASGSMDALAFFNLGEVFPSAMTGNTALLGLALGQGHVIAASRPFVAFVGFLAGAVVAAASVDLWLDKLPAPRAVSWLLVIEACLLAAFALAWQFIDWPITGGELYGLIVIASSGMGIQSVAARLVGRSGITTVVFTSTLTSIVTSATEAILRPPHRLPFATKRQIWMFLIYGVGAAIAGLLASHGAWLAFLPFVTVVGAAGFLRHEGQRNGSRT